MRSALDFRSQCPSSIPDRIWFFSFLPGLCFSTKLYVYTYSLVTNLPGQLRLYFQVYLVAEDMFREMVHGGRCIPKTEMDSAVTHLLSSGGRYEDSPQLIKSAKGLRTAVKRMLCSALESNHSDEVCVYQAV